MHEERVTDELSNTERDGDSDEDDGTLKIWEKKLFVEQIFTFFKDINWRIPSVLEREKPSEKTLQLLHPIFLIP